MTAKPNDREELVKELFKASQSINVTDSGYIYNANYNFGALADWVMEDRALTEQGSRSIGLDRKKLSKLLYDNTKYRLSISQDCCDQIADVIINEEKELIVFKG